MYPLYFRAPLMREKLAPLIYAYWYCMKIKGTQKLKGLRYQITYSDVYILLAHLAIELTLPHNITVPQFSSIIDSTTEYV